MQKKNPKYIRIFKRIFSDGRNFQDVAAQTTFEVDDMSFFFDFEALKPFEIARTFCCGKNTPAVQCTAVCAFEITYTI